MRIEKLIEFLEQWAPREIAWEKDNTGFQVGNPKDNLKGIVITLDVNQVCIEEAIKKKCNLIISHHPLMFQPIKSLNFQNPKNLLIQTLIQNNISVYSAHTNLDFTKEGVSYCLAEKLGLKNIKFLAPLNETQLKLITFIPKEYVQKLISALSEAGAGIIGEYSHCSYRTIGIGTLKGSEASNPRTGKRGKFEEVEEYKLEMVLDKWKLNSALKVLYQNHPYEEPAIDIIPLANKNLNYGYGAFGQIDKELTPLELAKLVKTSLKAATVKWTKGKALRVSKVAVCGGSGSELIEETIRKKCDALVTSDIKYHTFLDYYDKITIIDVGHYYSEVVVLDKIKDKIHSYCKSLGIKMPLYISKQKVDEIKVL
ncbi:MAG: Nif3-like dinuclear metal center hexameric protein [Ignavibacteria bacterium]|nr:Nif3-like dinuclear metal center hexameric protein [Ignavibacteria bacterium]